MEKLEFSIVLKELPVVLRGKDEIAKNYKLKELTSKQRNKYNESFDVKFEMEGTKAKVQAGDAFRMVSATEFLAMCLYDEEDKLVPEGKLHEFPASVTTKLHAAALKLSGMDAEAVELAKNESEESDISGTE